MSEQSLGSVRFATERNEAGRVLDTLGRILLRRRSLAVQLSVAVGAVGLATAIRFVINDYLPPGFPFLTFFPAVLVTALFASIRAAIVVAIISGLIARYFFIEPAGSFRLNDATAVAMLFYAIVTATEITFIAATHAALRALRASEERASRLARSRELMFAELQHRVSNNLATIGALLRMQAAQSEHEEVKQALAAGQMRLSTVARLQRRLHAPDEQEVDVAAFLKTLAEEAVEVASAGMDVVLKAETDPLRLDRDRALPLGLIASELLMNAVEHGRPNEGARIALVLRVTEAAGDGGRQVALDVTDNGPGLSAQFEQEAAGSLGLGIAREFARQLGGDVSLSAIAGGGTRARLIFTI